MINQPIWRSLRLLFTQLYTHLHIWSHLTKFQFLYLLRHLLTTRQHRFNLWNSYKYRYLRWHSYSMNPRSSLHQHGWFFLFRVICFNSIGLNKKNRQHLTIFRILLFPHFSFMLKIYSYRFAWSIKRIFYGFYFYFFLSLISPINFYSYNISRIFLIYFSFPWIFILSSPFFSISFFTLGKLPYYCSLSESEDIWLLESSISILPLLLLF